MQAIPAWDAVEASAQADVVVAVIDTGVDYSHPDMADNMWVNPGEIPGNGIDDDGNGYVDDVHGYDFVYNDPDPDDVYGHGTHCAGTIAAVGNNATGIVGIASGNTNKVKIMALKGLGDDGSGSVVGLANAVVYAVDNGANITSNSWGGFGSSQTLTDVFSNYAYNSGGVISVAAAGNSNMDVEGFFPASIPTVVAVAAVNYLDNKASFSNFGAQIDVSAPGVDVLSLNANGGANNIATRFPSLIVDTYYLRLSGTSMACPHISGLAGLLLSQHPAWLPAQIIGQFVGTADPIDVLNPNYAGELGIGRANAFRAVTEEQPFRRLDFIRHVITEAIGDGNGSLESGETAHFTFVLKNLSGIASGLRARLTLDPYLVPVVDEILLSDLEYWGYMDTTNTPLIFEVSPDAPSNYQASVELTVTDSLGLILVNETFQVLINVVSNEGNFLRLSSNPFADIDADIDGDIVVWDGRLSKFGPTKIFLYDLANRTEFLITDNDYSNSDPRVSGNLVVYQSHRNGSDGLFLCEYDSTTGTCPEVTLAFPKHTVFKPSIDGDRVVWVERNAAGQPLNLKFCEYANGGCVEDRVIVSNLYFFADADISGDFVVWDERRDGSPRKDMYLYDLLTEHIVPIDINYELEYRKPKIDGTTIAWHYSAHVNGVDTNGIYYCEYDPQTLTCPCVTCSGVQLK